MLYLQLLAGNFHNQFSKLVNSDHLFRTDIYGTRKIRLYESSHSLNTLVNK